MQYSNTLIILSIIMSVTTIIITRSYRNMQLKFVWEPREFTWLYHPSSAVSTLKISKKEIWNNRETRRILGGTIIGSCHFHHLNPRRSATSFFLGSGLKTIGLVINCWTQISHILKTDNSFKNITIIMRIITKFDNEITEYFTKIRMNMVKINHIFCLVMQYPLRMTKTKKN